LTGAKQSATRKRALSGLRKSNNRAAVSWTKCVGRKERSDSR